ncbi:hypothetical protein [Ensifer canadensis]
MTGLLIARRGSSMAAHLAAIEQRDNGFIRQNSSARHRKAIATVVTLTIGTIN